MRAYVVRRLLLMIPTFFGISLVLFVVLNLAPGRPGASRPPGDGASEQRDQASEASYRIFREQFDLDKPVLLNTYFALSRDDVRTPPCAPRSAGSGRRVSRARVQAQQTLADYGGYAVPHLIAGPRGGRAGGRSGAARRRRSFAGPGGAAPAGPPVRPRPDVRGPCAQPRDPGSRTTRCAASATTGTLRRTRSVRWSRAGATGTRPTRERFEYDGWARLRVLFFETRFAAYWRNLLRLDFGVSRS